MNRWMNGSCDAYLVSPADFAGADDIITYLAKEREPGIEIIEFTAKSFFISSIILQCVLLCILLFIQHTGRWVKGRLYIWTNYLSYCIINFYDKLHEDSSSRCITRPATNVLPIKFHHTWIMKLMEIGSTGYFLSVCFTSL